MCQTNELKFERHISASFAQDLTDLLSPLKYCCNINHFAYQKLYATKEVEFVTTHPDITDFFWQNKFYEKIFFGNIDNYKTGHYLMTLLNDQHIEKVTQAIKQGFNIDNNFVVIKKRTDFCEFYYFATKKENNTINGFYLNNIDLFENFILYFKEKAHKMLVKIAENKFFFPNSNDKSILAKPENSKICPLNEVYKTYKRINNDNITLNKFLTAKELSCLKHVIQGLSAKETAQLMNISNRTVEKHIENIKNKLKCKNKSALILKSLQYKYAINDQLIL